MASNQIDNIVKTKIPLNFYFIMSITVVFILLILPASLLKTIFYEVFIFFYLYVFFGRDACKIELTDIELKIKYIYFWEKDITISLDTIYEVDYEKGFYDLFSNKTRSGLFVFPKYCSDRLILKIRRSCETKVIFININTRLFEFDKFFKSLQLRIEKDNNFE